MESYNQPWTVVNKFDQYQSEPKTYEYLYSAGVEGLHKKPQYETYANKWEQLESVSAGKWEKPEGVPSKWEKPEWTSGKWEKPEYCGGKWEKPEGVSSRWEKPEWISGKWEKPEWTSGKWEKPEYCGGKWEKPEWTSGKWEKPEWTSGKWEKPEHCGGKWEKLEGCSRWEKPEWTSGKWEGKWEQLEGVFSRWEKPEWKNIENICESFERLERPTGEGLKPRWRCEGNKCCDVEMVNLVKDMINMLIGAEQSYIQLGFLCMDEKFTLVNTSEYFRLCGLRMHWLANGLINKSVRLFNVNEWINQTTFENFFKVPTKEELATNDYTGIIKTFFKIAIEAETRLVERMTVLGDKMIKADWVNSECRFDGFKWFVNFVLPYQCQFVREMTGHWRNIEMCNNGFVFDKCEMYPLVQKIEEFIRHITKINTTGVPVWEKNGPIPVNKKW